VTIVAVRMCFGTHAHYTLPPQAYTAEQLTESVVGHIADWKAAHPGEYHPEIKEIAKPEGPQLRARV
jgi:hypothetical protein